MRIAVNTLFASSGDFGGARYICNLVRGLAEIDPDNEYTVYVPGRHIQRYSGLGRNFTLVPTVSYRPLRILWEQTALPMDLRRRKIEVYHGPGFVTPVIKTCRQVLTVFDMTYFNHPEGHLFTKGRYFRALIPGSVARSDRVIAISQSAKTDIIRILGTPPQKIEVTYLGWEEKFRPIAERECLEDIRKKYRLTRKVVLFVGVIEPRKNLVTLIQAFKHLKVLHAEYTLVIGGSLGWDYEGILRAAGENGISEHIRMPGFIPAEDLPALYNLAEVFVYPSLYEGFGLPVLEAMACGTPVITSNISSMPEVAGDAGVLVDPTDVEGLANALERVLKDSALRRRMREKGLERSRMFSWEETARQTLAVYYKAAGM